MNEACNENVSKSLEEHLSEVRSAAEYDDAGFGRRRPASRGEATTTSAIQSATTDMANFRLEHRLS